MTYGSHLRRSRHGILYFRYVIPRDVRAIIGRSEVCVSLGTASRRAAELTCLELQLAAKRVVDATRRADSMTGPREPKLAALHAMVQDRRFKVLQGELSEADATIAAKDETIEALKAKLISTLDTQRAPPISDVGPLLSKAIAEFKAERNATGAWTSKTAGMWDSRLRLLVEWFGDVPVSGLSREEMTGFLNALKLLPKNASKYKVLDGKGMRELVQVEEFDRIASGTVNQVMECMSALFAWMDADRAKWKVSGNIAKGLTLSNATSATRVAFTADDLRAMFSAPEWKARKFLHSYGYWLLPLGLFTGARINELCQLDLKDFRSEHGHPVVSLCTEGLRGKNSNARRVVPVHPELVRIGLLRHVERLQQSGATKLFPECVAKRDGHGQDASRWFGKFKLRAGIVDSRKVFHSTRHGFVSQLLDAGIDEATVALLVGHAGSSESSRTYWNEKDVRRLIDVVKLVRNPVVAEMVPVVESVSFGVDVHRSRRRPPVRKIPITESKRSSRGHL